MSCSVVLLTYNGAKYLEKMLQSVKRQTYRPIQLIIADDASQDGTVKIAENFAQKNQSSDFCIKIICHKRNKGRSGNRTSVLPIIKGEYVFLADQDDIWEKDKLTKQIEFLRNNPECFGVGCDRKLIDKNGTVLLRSENRYAKGPSRHKKVIDFESNLDFRSNYPANCIGFKNLEIEKVFSVPEEMEEPDRFLRMMILCMGKIGFVNETFVQYRIHSNNLSGNYYSQIHKSYIKILKYYIDRNKRYNRIYEKDDLIIINEAMNRFQIDLNDSNKYRKREKVNVYLDSFQRLIQDIKHKRVGSFLKGKAGKKAAK